MQLYPNVLVSYQPNRMPPKALPNKRLSPSFQWGQSQKEAPTPIDPIKEHMTEKLKEVLRRIVNPVLKDRRSPDLSVAGIRRLGTMIDRARVDAAGLLAPREDYPCRQDRYLLDELGIDAPTFQTIVINSKNDTEIVDALRQQGVSIPKSNP